MVPSITTANPEGSAHFVAKGEHDDRSLGRCPGSVAWNGVSAGVSGKGGVSGLVVRRYQSIRRECLGVRRDHRGVCSRDTKDQSDLIEHVLMNSMRHSLYHLVVR